MWCAAKNQSTKKESAITVCKRQTENINVTSHHTQQTAAAAPTSTGTAAMIPEVNADLLGLESHTLLIRRGRHGFGFTIVGSSPVQIGRVDEASDAGEAGLLVGDYIVRINGQNVSRSSADSVARIVRDSERHLVLEIQRPLPVVFTDELSCSPWIALGYDIQQQRDNQVESKLKHHVEHQSEQHQAHYKEHSLSSRLLNSSVRSRSPFSPLINQLSCPVTLNSRTSSHNTCLVDPDRSDSPACTSERFANPNLPPPSSTFIRTGLSSALSSNRNRWSFRVNSSTPIITNKLNHKVSHTFEDRCVAGCLDVNGADKENYVNSEPRDQLERMLPKRSSSVSAKSKNTCLVSGDFGKDDHCLDMTNKNWQKIKDDDVHDQSSTVRKLIEFEERFALDMQLGVQQYLRPLYRAACRKKNAPLRAASTSATAPGDDINDITLSDHCAIFQNIEKISDLSNTCVRKLRACRIWQPPANMQVVDQPMSTNDQMTEQLGGTDEVSLNERHSQISVAALSCVYAEQIQEYCEAYELYCGGVKEAFRSLVALKRKSADFEHFVRTASADSGSLTLSKFLTKPLEHIKDVVVGLQSILSYTSKNCKEYDRLKNIIQSMRTCCQRINETNTQKYGSSLSLSSTVCTVPCKSASSSLTSSSSSFSTTASVVSSIDMELLDIQNRLVFPPEIPTFNLATASRHMIFSGNLLLVNCASSDIAGPLPLFTVLMSDLILLTRPDPETQALHIIEEPIALHDIVGCNFLDVHPCEFHLSVETPLTGLQEAWQPLTLQLRAPSSEMKSTWKNILEQRILLCKSQREIKMSSRTMDNVV